MLKRHGYEDWAGDISGYGAELEIRCYAVCTAPDAEISTDLTRSAAARNHSSHGLASRGFDQSKRIEALLGFSDQFKS